jgi:prophage antirepressor-like protein
MSQSIIPFHFHASDIRIVMRNGEPWFIASDVAAALGYRNAPDAARYLSDHQKGSTLIERRTSGGNPNVTIINESGLYRLVLRSRKPEALAFSDWVTGEVLPSIRKTGGYGKQTLPPGCAMVTLEKSSAFIEYRLGGMRQSYYVNVSSAFGSRMPIAGDAVIIQFREKDRPIMHPADWRP